MGEVIDFKTQSQTANKPITDDEARLLSIYDVAVGLIIDIEEGKTFSMSEITARMVDVIEIIQEEL